MSREIELTRGFKAIVDDEDYPRLAESEWYAIGSVSGPYAARDEAIVGRRQCIYMHRTIAGATPTDGVDHVNGNGLDNRRSNLRLANQSQNMGNAQLSRANGSGFKGVTWDGARGRWQAKVMVKGRTIHLGRFDDRLQAAKAYDVAAEKCFGEFARTNQGMGLLS